MENVEKLYVFSRLSSLVSLSLISDISVLGLAARSLQRASQSPRRPSGHSATTSGEINVRLKLHFRANVRI